MGEKEKETVQIEFNKLNESKAKESNDKSIEPQNAVSVAALFRYATKQDIAMILIGTLASMIQGATFPLMLLFFTNIVDTFTSFGSLECYTPEQLLELDIPEFDLNAQLREQVYYLCGLAGVSLVASYFQVAFWMMPAEKQTRVIRKTLFRAILRQDIGWFDVYKSGELTSRLTEDINKVKDGIGDKFGNAIQFSTTAISGIIIGFIKGWKLTLVILAISPVLFVVSFIFTKLVASLTNQELKSYAKAGAVAEEVISAIRTVFAFNGQEKDHKRYESKLEESRKSGIKKALMTGVLMGTVWLVIEGAYALGFWYGWTLSLPNGDTPAEYTVGKILIVFFSIIIGVFSLGNAAPFFGTLTNARAAAYEVFKIIDRVPPINYESTQGEKPNEVIGNIEFRDVSFNYPSRADVQILNSLSFQIKAGQTVALVGGSGCGKSTCIQLLQRFYDVHAGSVTIDNRNVKDLNLTWLRSQIGVVNQEPVLFSSSIIDNIRFGRDNLTQEEIIEAAKNANAHDFIMKLPDKYDTLVGDRGSQLSGGQKQRIAIARALVRNPKILLLDEATSALDNESESIVQEALDQASHGRTTIIVAHRLSTIRNANVIFALDKGKVAESGTHDELMAKKGIYYTLVINQQTGMEKSKKNNKDKKSKSSEGENTEISKKDGIVEEEQEKKKKNVPLGRVLSLNKPEWYLILIGCIAAAVTGGSQPAFSIILSKAIGIFQKCGKEEQEKGIILYCILFATIGVILFISNFFQAFMFGLSGENMTKRLRSTAFKTILRQEIGWFDQKENNVGTLCTRLSVEAAAVQGATGIRIGTFIMNICNFGIGLILAFVYGWAITLVILAFVPFLILSGVLQTKLMTGFAGKDKKVIEEAGKLTNEAISNIRTVAILNKETHFLTSYSNKIDIPYKSSIRSANVFGIMLGVTNSLVFIAMAIAFLVGGIIIDKGLFGLDFEKIMIVFNCVLFGAQSVGQASSMMPDYAKARLSVVKLFELFDRVPKIDNCDSTSGTKLEEIDNEIKFKDVEFAYPTRPEVKVLNKFNITIKKGQKIALVGSSGCGKSTITQLLERFYDPDTGDILINEHKSTSLNLHWLRSQMGIVSQEPILFDTSIADNIAYGDNSRKVTMNEIIDAAKLANIHDFISTLPEGYNTNVGSKGTQLSGGQKQRVSIARALIRNPKILLLDEATSALDTESEKIVQEALERAQEGRTSIVIAHRLSTIRNSDLIFVIQNGVVTEVGNHDELIRLNGFYAKLNNQNSENEAVSPV